MVTVIFEKDTDGFVQSITATGHACYAEHGSDIICSSVSTLLYTCIGATEEICSVDGFYKINESDGNGDSLYVRINFPENLDGNLKNKARVIFETTRIGLKQLFETVLENYGESYLEIIEEKP